MKDSLRMRFLIVETIGYFLSYFKLGEQASVVKISMLCQEDEPLQAL